MDYAGAQKRADLIAFSNAAGAKSQLSLFPVPFYPPLALRLGGPGVNVRHRILSLVAKTLTFAAIARCRGWQHLPESQGSDTLLDRPRVK
jgi:hypothetical protein